MDFVSLVDYVKEGELFEKIEGEYEQIVSDYNFGDFDFGNSTFLFINNYAYFDYVDLNKKTLFILDKLIIDNLVPFITSIHDCTILDLNYGITGFGAKIGISTLNILDLLDLGFGIFEPMDLSSFISDLNFNISKKYFRLSNFDLPENIVDGVYYDVFSFEQKGFFGNDFTIISTGTFLPEVVRLGNLLQLKGINVSIQIINRLDNIKFDNLNPNVVFLFDGVNFGYDIYIKNLLSSKGINLKIISPNYKKLSTVLGDYILEDLDFDSNSIVSRLGL